MGKSRKSLTRESRRVHFGQWSQKLQALQRGGDRSRPRLGGGPGSREAGGTLSEVQGDWRTRMRGGGALGEELTGRPSRERADWTVRKEPDQRWPFIGSGGPRRRGQHAREGGRASGAGLPASRSSYERGGERVPARPRSSPPVRRAPAGGLETRSAAERRGASGGGRGKQGGGVEARCAAAGSSPGAAGPGRAGLRGARTMRAGCRPPRWRAGRR